ncbi:hypothetical protein [Microcoleus sp. N3A4]|uniref:hypothetical protein n=1 Tax=Microcoleus sp. N3A4 TaxID=3055379 RepID=UPI002FD4C9CD
MLLNSNAIVPIAHSLQEYLEKSSGLSQGQTAESRNLWSITIDKCRSHKPTKDN